MTITLKNVTKIIGGNTVADSVNLTLKSGTVYGLCGYNGCGKTMLMRLISGLILPTKGDIFFDEKKLGKDIDFPENMGILIENPAFLGGLSGFDNLKLLASIKGKITDDIIKKTISRVGLDPDDKKKYRKYSLGMKQRLGIASAIMEAPELIILDEPTNALDSSGVEIVKKIIASEKKRGALITVTCHDHAILQEMCDIIYKIEHGKIIDEQVISEEVSANEKTDN
ncbi:MAG: ATP-binding cassette domain-containing protein [Ruminococcus sp.]|nr:ATP-binding cassette domain-containing protein [Ruminococcus sp.]